MSNKKIMIICGTRPEAIKMAPLVVALQSSKRVTVTLCSTGQHREMLDQVLSLFEVVPDFNLNVMKADQDLTDVTTEILVKLRELFKVHKPDRVIVHGDTCTTLSASLAAYYASIPVSHVEAGLRTHDIYSPWPEEANRRLTSVLADRHYAPTDRARQNLLNEAVAERSIIVTGNTVIDALLMMIRKLEVDYELKAELVTKFNYLDSQKKLILVTGHRRENFGDGFVSICEALSEIAKRDDVQIVYPVHLNPNVQLPVKKYLDGLASVFLIEPLDYLPFIYLMSRCHHIITDSGGVQEEAPSLGKPVLVMRDSTERPEAVLAKTVRLVGTEKDKIIEESNRLLDSDNHYKTMSVAINPYGDGTACMKIIEDLLR